jgi:hypothetical protein
MQPKEDIMIKLGQNQANNNNKDNHGEVATTTTAV